MNPRGRPRVKPRDVVNGILWILTTRQPWSRLPAHYPSGPTCRRRFKAWHTDGTLDEIVRRLSQSGRPSISTRKVPAPSKVPQVRSSEPQRVCEDTWAGVVWRAPQAWQSPKSSGGRHGPADPIVSITRHLSDPPPANPSTAPTNIVAREPHDSTASLPGRRRRDQAFPAADGLLIHAGIEELSGGLFRAWAEILRDGVRIVRSGLIGPRFESAEAATRHALDWAGQWIAGQGQRDGSVATSQTGVAEPAVMGEKKIGPNRTALPGHIAKYALPDSAPVDLAEYGGCFRVGQSLSGTQCRAGPLDYLDLIAVRKCHRNVRCRLRRDRPPTELR